jgi:hypothetical protein
MPNSATASCNTCEHDGITFELISDLGMFFRLEFCEAIPIHRLLKIARRNVLLSHLKLATASERWKLPGDSL